MNRFSKTMTLVLALAMVFSGSAAFAGTDTVERTLSYSASTITASSYDGYALIDYPEGITEGDVAAFLSYEAEKYPADAALVTYSFPEDGVLRLDYPEGLSAEERGTLLDAFLGDIKEFAPEEESVFSFAVGADEVTVAVTSSYADISYPASITESDVEAFFAYEVDKRGAELDGITYSFPESGIARLSYPAEVAKETAEAYVPVLASDAAEFAASLAVPAEDAAVVEEAAVPEPSVYTFDFNGSDITITIYGSYADIAYPEYITEGEVEAFFAYEVEMRGAELDGITYSFPESGIARLSYPAEVSKETAEAYAPVLASDLTAYVSQLMSQSEEVYAEAEPVATAAEEPSVEEDAVYPYGIQPIVKNAQGDSEFDLFVVHTNDVHGRIAEGEDGSAGYSKLSTLIDMARSITDNILLLDAGDTFHGTNLANMFYGQTVAEIMDIVGYDAVVPGNHDFNYGYERLEEIAAWAEDNATYRILCANITDEDGYLVFQPYQVYDYNGFKVCVLGLSTPDTKTKSHPKNTEGLDFISDEVIDNAQYAIDLANELCDYVIVLGHLGVVPDGESGITSTYVCENLDGIDLFVDGHSHTVMDGGEMVNGTLIVSTGQYMNNVGVVQIHVNDGEGTITDAFLIPAEEIADPSGSELFASLGITEIPSNPVVDQYIEEKNAELEEVLAQVVANVPMNLNGERADVRTRKTNLAKLITDAMTAESGADFTIVNGGGIRASITAGSVTLGDINNVLPFTNTIVVCEISPADIYAALEHGYSMLPEQNGAFSQTDLKVVYSAKAPAGERIKRVYLGDQLLDPNDTTTLYKVATNDFMAAGGDGYTMFGRVLTEGSMLNEVFISYLEKLYPIN